MEMSADELRGVSPHAPTGNVFGVNRKAWKAKPVPIYTPRKTPFSITFFGFIGHVLIGIGIVALALSAAMVKSGEGFNATVACITGISMMVTGPVYIVVWHVAKAVMRIDDMLAHKLSHRE